MTAIAYEGAPPKTEFLPILIEGLGEVPSWHQEAEAGKEPKRGAASMLADLVGVERPKPLLAMVCSEENAPLAGDPVNRSL